jgi:LysM repeat protein
MKFLKVTMIALACALAAAVLFAPSAAQAQTGGVNLLVDGDFEAPPTWPQQDGIGEVQVAPGWRAWYLDVPPSYVQVPVNCNDRSDGYHCYWMRPEFRDNTSFDNRIHSGARSQKYFSYGRMHEAGLYQQVGGIRPGAALRFAIAIQSWQCFNIDKCGKNGILSDYPAEMHLRVGIDPYGGTDPFSPNIVWSPEQEAFDRWVEFSVEAVAKNDTVTVFTHSRPDWSWARLNNDVYLDDASLVVIDKIAGRPAGLASAVSTTTGTLRQTKKYRGLSWQPDCDTPTCHEVNLLGASSVLTPDKPAPVSAPAAPAASTSVTPSAAPVTSTVSSPATPAPSGAPRTYVVVEGDTLSQIAKRFNTTMEAIMQANQITNADFVWKGQTLIIP